MRGLHHQIIRALALSVVVLLAACAAPQDGELIADPIQPVNRAVHGFNKGLDTVVLRPASQVYAAVVPDPVERGLENFSGNLSLPADTVNTALQGRGMESWNNLHRFIINTVFGIGGIFDVATEWGFERTPTGFGETLARWGAEEGIYLELPAVGPSNTRDAIGFAVDVLTNPFTLAGSPAAEIATAGRVVQIIDFRDEFGDQIDAALYESEDSYTTSKSAFVQNRRRTVSDGEQTPDDFNDIYAE